MSKSTDVRVVGVRSHLIRVPMRVPLKFGAQTLTEVQCLRVGMRVVDGRGARAVGWGETPLSVGWGWPSDQLSYADRESAMIQLAQRLTADWASGRESGHPLELGWDRVEGRLPELMEDLNRARAGEAMPRLAGLITASAFDLALHDAYGHAMGRPVYETYGPAHLNRDLAAYLEPDTGGTTDFRGRYPADFLVDRVDRLPAWHLVGGLDPVDATELRGDEPRDGYPVTLEDWVKRDGLTCLKIKLRGTDAAWDLQRLMTVGRLALACGVRALSADFNCTVRDPAYVVEVLEQWRSRAPAAYERLLYVEQPFPHDLEAASLDVREVSTMKPLFLDESAHDWRVVRLGRRLGWTGVALKTCKTQSGALLSLAWARAHGMALMVQDLTNPMLAQLPHLLLAAHAGTLHGVETNGMQYYPEASRPEAAVHPGCYVRRGGEVDLSTLRGPGFGYRLGEMKRVLEAPIAEAGETGW